MNFSFFFFRFFVAPVCFTEIVGDRTIEWTDGRTVCVCVCEIFSLNLEFKEVKKKKKKKLIVCCCTGSGW